MGIKSGVRVRSESSIEIDFYYQGVRCRERLKLSPTPANLKYAKNLKSSIEIAIEKGTFEYADYFPNSRFADKLQRFPEQSFQLSKHYRRGSSELRRPLNEALIKTIGIQWRII